MERKQILFRVEIKMVNSMKSTVQTYQCFLSEGYKGKNFTLFHHFNFLWAMYSTVCVLFLQLENYMLTILKKSNVC